MRGRECRAYFGCSYRKQRGQVFDPVDPLRRSLAPPTA
jgi:hypothetical protein